MDPSKAFVVKLLPYPACVTPSLPLAQSIFCWFIRLFLEIPKNEKKSSRKWRFWGCSWMRTRPVPTFGMLTEKISLKAIRIVCSYHNKYFRPVTLHSGTTPEALFSCDLEANGRRINNEISLFPLAPSSPSTWSLRSRALQQQQHAPIPRVGHQV